MKAYVLQVLVIDHDELGPDEIKAVLSSTWYPNDCIAPEVLGSVEHDIGEWSDAHPLNQVGVDAARWLAAREPCNHKWVQLGTVTETCQRCSAQRLA